MEKNETFIKLNRKILNWGWYKDVNTFKLFIHLLLKANFKDSMFMGQTIKRGQLVTSLSKLAGQSGLTIKSVRTALFHLKTTKEVAISTTPKFSIITIVNYEKYQKVAKLSANNGHAGGTLGANRGATSKEVYNNKLLYTKKKVKKVRSTVTFSEIQKFVAENHLNVNCEKFFDYYSKRNWQTANGEPIEDVGQLLMTWHKKEKQAYASGYGKFKNEFTREDYLAMLKEQEQEKKDVE